MEYATTAFQAGYSLVELLDRIQGDVERAKKFKAYVSRVTQTLEVKLRQRHLDRIRNQPANDQDLCWSWLYLGVLIQSSSDEQTRSNGVAVWAPPAPKHNRLGCLQEAAKRVPWSAATQKPESAPLWYNIGLMLEETEAVDRVGGTQLTRRECFALAVEEDPGLPLPWIHLGLSLTVDGMVTSRGIGEPTGLECLKTGVVALEDTAAQGTVIEEHYSLSLAYHALGRLEQDKLPLEMNGRTHTKEELLAAAVQYDLTRWGPWNDLLALVDGTGQQTVKWSPAGDDVLHLKDLRVLRAQWRALEIFHQQSATRDEFQKRVSVLMHHDDLDEEDPFVRTLKALDQCLRAAMNTIDAHQNQPFAWQVVSAIQGTLSTDIDRHERDIEQIIQLYGFLADSPTTAPPRANPQGGGEPPLDRSMKPQVEWGYEVLKPYFLNYPPRMMELTLRTVDAPRLPQLKTGWIGSRRVAVEYRKATTLQAAWEELKCLATAIHPHIVRLEGYHERMPGNQQQPAVYVVLEPLEQVGLTNEFLRSSCVSWLNRVEWSLSLLDAVSLLHSLGFSHNNICAEHIWFCAGDGPTRITLKLGGFECAKSVAGSGEQQMDLSNTLKLLKLFVETTSPQPGISSGAPVDKVQEALAAYRSWLATLKEPRDLGIVKQRLREIQMIRNPVRLTGSHSSPSPDTAGASLSCRSALRSFGESAVMGELTRRIFDAQGLSVSLSNSPTRLDNELRRLNRVGRKATSLNFINCAVTDRHLENYLPGLCELREVTIALCRGVANRSLQLLIGRDPRTTLRPYTQLESVTLYGSNLFSDEGLEPLLKASPKLRRLDLSGTSVGESTLRTLAELVTTGFITGLTSFSLRHYVTPNIPDDALLRVIQAIGPTLTTLELMRGLDGLPQTLAEFCPKLESFRLTSQPPNEADYRNWAADKASFFIGEQSESQVVAARSA